jgi:peptide/nickel transport system permease protein
MLFALFGISVIIFVLIRLIPGDTVSSIMGTAVNSPEAAATMRAYFGLDQPIWKQYVHWLGQFIQGDMGMSWRNRMTVTSLILQRIPVTIELTVLAMLLSVLSGVPLGVLAAVKRNTLVDGCINILSTLSLSIPEFFQGIVMIVFFSVALNWIPSVRYVSFLENPAQNLIIMLLPALSIGTVRAANVVRMTRSCLLEVLSSQYVVVARAKGLQEKVVIFKHALRNALIPIVTIIGLQVGYLLSGAVVVEMVFSLPGIGRLLVLAITQRDFPLVQGITLTISFLFLSTNLLVDVLYSFIDPRVSHA